MRQRRFVIALSAAAVLMSACSTATTTGGNPQENAEAIGKYGTFIIGRTPDTQGELMAQLYGQALRAQGVDVAFTIPSTIPVFIGALEQRGIAMVATPLSTLADSLYGLDTGSSAAAPRSVSEASTLAEARKSAQEHGFALLTPTPAAPAPAYAVTREFSAENRITTLSELATWADSHPLRFAGPLSCYLSSTCLQRVESVYRLNVHDYEEVEGTGKAVVEALQGSSADAGYLASTDVAVLDPDIVVLDADKPLQVYGNVTPAVITPRSTGAINARIDLISAMVTGPALTQMVRMIDAGEASAAEVAEYFLEANRISAPVDALPIPTVGVDLRAETGESAGEQRATAQVIGIAHGATTAMEIIAHLYQGALDIEGIPTEMLDDTVAAQDVPSGFLHHEFQLIPTLLGVAAQTVRLQSHGPLALPVTGTPQEMVAQANEDAQQWGYEFLRPSDAEDGPAFTVGRSFAKRTGITTLTELSRYSQQSPVTLAGPPGCAAESDCARFLREQYDVRIDKVLTTDWGGPLTRAAVDSGAADTGLMLDLDPGIPYFGFTALTDDRAKAAPANVTPAISLSAATPAVVRILDRLSARLDPEEIAELTTLYELMGYSMDYVVTHALEEYGFLPTRTTVELSPDND